MEETLRWFMVHVIEFNCADAENKKPITKRAKALLSQADPVW